MLGRYLDDEAYRALQNHLIVHPQAGAVIRGSGGVRKIRWGVVGIGKSGGIRVIYYWAKAANQVFMLSLYGKREKEDLTSADLRKIAGLLSELTHD